MELTCYLHVASGAPWGTNVGHEGLVTAGGVYDGLGEGGAVGTDESPGTIPQRLPAKVDGPIRGCRIE